jgi:hypothetical protein
MCLLKQKSDTVTNALKNAKSLTFNDFDLVFYRSIKEFAALLPAQNNVFLSVDYLETLEQNPPLGFQFAYVLVLKNKSVVGFLPFQIKHFKATESLNFSDKQNPLVLGFKRTLAKKVNFNTLIAGSLLLTGEYSYWFDKQQVTNSEINELLLRGVNFAKKTLTEYKVFIESVFIKDFFEPQEVLDTDETMGCFSKEKYNRFKVEPNFIMDVPADWKTFDDYLNALGSKYRVRAKRAFKKIEMVEKKEFNEERIIAYQLEINALYRQVCNRSAVNMVDLHDNYFLALKQNLGERFKLYGYFADKKLIGFYTTIENEDALDAHYLGYDESQNHAYQTYLNFLFDIVKNGIEMGAKHIVFSRTAHEIKSSVGAVAHDMYLYLKHDRAFINRILPYTLPILSPPEIWLPRSPFKTGKIEEEQK